MLIPNVEALENTLRYFAEIIEAEEVLLFERATFLVISHYQRVEHRDSHRFEKVSNIIKQFKLSCSKLGAKFQSIEVFIVLFFKLTLCIMVLLLSRIDCFSNVYIFMVVIKCFQMFFIFNIYLFFFL